MAHKRINRRYRVVVESRPAETEGRPGLCERRGNRGRGNRGRTPFLVAEAAAGEKYGRLGVSPYEISFGRAGVRACSKNRGVGGLAFIFLTSHIRPSMDGKSAG
jgi:hypothetical protein